MFFLPEFFLFIFILELFKFFFWNSSQQTVARLLFMQLHPRHTTLYNIHYCLREPLADFYHRFKNISIENKTSKVTASNNELHTSKLIFFKFLWTEERILIIIR